MTRSGLVHALSLCSVATVAFVLAPGCATGGDDLDGSGATGTGASAAGTTTGTGGTGTGGTTTGTGGTATGTGGTGTGTGGAGTGTGGTATGTGGTGTGTGGTSTGTGGTGTGTPTGTCTNPPDPATNPLPADGANDVDYETVTTVDWDHAAGATSYDVYFGACPVPSYPDPSFTNVVASTLTGLSLLMDTDYCWQVVSRTVSCATPGPAWTFRTDPCHELVPGPPVPNDTTVLFHPCTLSGTYLLTFAENTQGVSMSTVTWTPVTGSGTLDSITPVNPTTYELAFTGVASGDVYTLTVGPGLSDDCGNVMTVAHDITIRFDTGSVYLSEDFDTFTGTYPNGQNGWSSNPVSGFSWQLDSDTTGSTDTGPAADHTGSGNYVYTEASNGSVGNTTTLTSPTIDLSLAANPALRFWYHMYGSTMGTLDVEVDGGSGYANVWTMTGEQQTDETDPWIEAVVDVSAYTGGPATIRFTGTRGSSYYSDMAIDDVTVGEDGTPGVGPVADFVLGGPPTPTIGEIVTLTDTTTNSPTSWLWTITGPGTETYENGTSATDQNPQVSFDTDGSYTVQLDVSSATGLCSNTFVDAIHIYDWCSVGSGTTTNQYVPMELYYNYSYTQTIYYSSEMCASGDIHAVSWEYNGNSASTETLVVWMGHTTKTEFTSTTDWVPISGLTQVYSGTLALTTTAGWYTITLDTPFPYNGTDNLLLVVDRNTGSYTSSSAEFYCDTSLTTNNRSIYHYSDGTNANPASPPTASGRNSAMPNTRLD